MSKTPLPAGFALSSWAPGVSVLKRGGREVATLERSRGMPCAVAEGDWFAYPSPSSADMMADQADRAGRAMAHGRTRQECAKRFVEWLGA